MEQTYLRDLMVAFSEGTYRLNQMQKIIKKHHLMEFRTLMFKSSLMTLLRLLVFQKI